jgi:F-type H+-transporting ATPase subunit epsilon
MFKLSIVSPERTLFEDNVESLIVPGGDGYLGILSHHAPLISTLKVGEISFRDTDKKEVVMATSGGFIEVSDNVASILVDTAEFLDEIDLSRAENELHRAEELLNITVTTADHDRAIHSREKALNRINLIKKYK